MLLLLSLLGATSTALVVWYVANEKEKVQVESDTESRWQIYSDAWDRHILQEVAKLESFGVGGPRGNFWLPQNAQPLNFNRSANRSNYFTDYSASATGTVENPVVKALMRKGNLGEAESFLTIFFGPALQRGELLFYRIIDAHEFRELTCRKSLFARDYDPCSTIFETYFIDKGSRLELYEELIKSSRSWNGYMVHSTSTEEHYNLLYSFPVLVGETTEFIVLVGRALDPIVKSLADEMNIDARVLNTARPPSFFEQRDDAAVVDFIGKNKSIRHTLITNSGIWCRLFPDFTRSVSSSCASTNRGGTSVLLFSLSEDADSDSFVQLALLRDVAELLDIQDSLTVTMITTSVGAVVFILLVIFFVQRSIFSPVDRAIVVLNTLTEGNNRDVEIPERNRFLTSEDDEVGRLVSALRAYKARLDELDAIRLGQRRERLERDRLIIEKMGRLSQQLEGEARALLMADIDRMEEIARSIENDEESIAAEGDSVKLISVAFERMSDQVIMLIDARTSELAVARDEASEANLAKSKFLANMSHELRTPLNAILGYSELLIEEAEDEGLESMIGDLQRITTAGTLLLNLINDILDISKIEAGRMELFLSDFEVENALEFLNTVAEPLANKNNNRVEFLSSGSLGTMHSDETRLRQGLLNLLSNACKFTENGTVTLTTQSIIQSGEDWLSFEVSDTGIGMTNEQMSKIFEDFTQAEADTSAKFGGTGLGLSITKQLIEMMGGNLSVESELGKGSTFRMLLPRETEVIQESEELEDVSGVGWGSTAGSRRILVIDDDAVVHDLVRRNLPEEQYELMSAYSGTQGLEMMRQHPPQLILLDIMMPGKDGWTVLAEMKKEPELESLPVIIVSMLEDDHSSAALGANAYVTKPIERSQLLKEISLLFEGDTEDKSALVVDDDPASRELVCRTLEGIGFSTTTAVNGAEGLEKLSADTDLVILDLDMPVMDGFEFLTEFNSRDMPNRPQVLVFSGMTLDETRRQTLTSQRLSVIQKDDVGIEQKLVSVVQQAFGRAVVN